MTFMKVQLFEFIPYMIKEHLRIMSFLIHLQNGLWMGLKATIAKYGDDYFVTSYQRWLLFERACWLRGVENFLTDMIVDRPFAEWLLDRITEYQVEVARKYIEIGIDCGRTGDDWGSQMGMLFSPDLWRGLIKPRLKKVWDVYHDAGLPVIHHSCGDIRPIIPDLIELGWTFSILYKLLCHGKN